MPVPSNVREARFIEEYLRDGNATSAAQRAGYSARSAKTIGREVLNRPHVAAAIRERRRQILQHLRNDVGLDIDRVVDELARILLLDIGDVFDSRGCIRPIHEWPEMARRALSGFDVEEMWFGQGDERIVRGRIVKVRFWSKTEAAQQLLRKLGAFRDVVEHQHTWAELVRAAADHGAPKP